jgi:hypothetical protein
VELYEKEQGRRAKSGLAVALSHVAGDVELRELIELAKRRENGESRILLLDALERSRLPQAQKALMELGADQELAKEVQAILARRRKKKR